MEGCGAEGGDSGKKKTVGGMRRKGKEVERENVERKQDGGDGVLVVRVLRLDYLKLNVGLEAFSRPDAALPHSLTPSLPHRSPPASPSVS